MQIDEVTTTCCKALSNFVYTMFQVLRYPTTDFKFRFLLFLIIDIIFDINSNRMSPTSAISKHN